VCGGPLEAHTEAYCDNCGQPYHLNQRTDLPGKDCGQVWINEEHLALEFACDTCLHPVAEPEALDDIIDSAEAAALAGIDEPQLLTAAASGALRHRKTAGGIYLFQRGDVVAFSQAGQ
jgi:hypothetical protein